MPDAWRQASRAVHASKRYDGPRCVRVHRDACVAWFLTGLFEIKVEPESTLRSIKVIHTLVWAVFAGSILAIPAFAFVGNVTIAWSLVGFVFLEVAVLVANRMKCPLTDVAERYTSNRQDNFDIYLPLWLARHNKQVFGGLYVAGILYAAWVSIHVAA